MALFTTFLYHLFSSIPLPSLALGIASSTRSSRLVHACYWGFKGMPPRRVGIPLNPQRSRRQLFVSSDSQLAMPLPTRTLVPFVNGTFDNTQPRCGALR